MTDRLIEVVAEDADDGSPVELVLAAPVGRIYQAELVSGECVFTVPDTVLTSSIMEVAATVTMIASGYTVTRNLVIEPDVVEVNPLSLTVEWTESTAIISNVSQNMTETTQTSTRVYWDVDPASGGQLQYRVKDSGDAYSFTSFFATEHSSHNFYLGGLMAGTTYEGYILSGGAVAAFEVETTADVEVPEGSYFVSKAGSNSNNGTTASTPMLTIQAALNVAPAGSVIYVKAGTYNENIVIPTSGGSSTAIIIEGYNTTPGDRPVYTNFGPDTALSSSRPRIDGQNRGVGKGISATGKSNITVRNLDVINFDQGIEFRSGSDNCNIIDVVIDKIGSTGAPGSDGFGILYDTASDDGFISKTMVRDATLNGITISRSDGTIVSDCKVISQDNSTGDVSNTDYYFYVASSTNTQWLRNEAIRDGTHEHGGHGFAVKDGYGTGATGNLFDGNTSTNTKGVIFWKPGANNNTARNHTVTGPDSWTMAEVRDGAHDNLMEDFVGDNPRRVISMFATGNETPTQNNTFRRFTATNVRENLLFTYAGTTYTDHVLSGNLFEDFDIEASSGNYLIRVGSNIQSSNLFKDCIFRSFNTKVFMNGGTYGLNSGSFQNVTITPASYSVP